MGSRDVLEELLQSVTLVAPVRRVVEDGQPRTLTRNEVILAGQMVPLAKLNRGLLQFCNPPQIELFGFVLAPLTAQSLGRTQIMVRKQVPTGGTRVIPQRRAHIRFARRASVSQPASTFARSGRRRVTRPAPAAILAACRVGTLSWCVKPLRR